MTTIREIRDTLMDNKTAYTDIEHQLTRELQAVRAEASSARSTLEPLVAGAVAALIPNLGSPAIITLQQIADDLGIKNGPVAVRMQMANERDAARAELAELEAVHGSQADLTDKHAGAIQSVATLGQAVFATDIKIILQGKLLRPLDQLNNKLADKGLSAVQPDALADYDRPAGRYAAALRWLRDPVYRAARPVLDRMVEDGIDIRSEAARRSRLQEENDRNRVRRNEEQAAAARCAATLEKMRTLSQKDRSDTEIRSAMRTATTEALMTNGGYLAAASKALPGAFPPETLALHSRVTLMGKLATRLEQEHGTVHDILGNMSRPLQDLDRAALRNGWREARSASEFEDNVRKMKGHQQLLRQRVGASHNIRAASRRPEAYSATSGDSDMLLWYLILSDSNSPAHASTPLFEGGRGGEYGGGGANGRWDDAPDSALRADLLGATPQSARDFGIDPGVLRFDATSLGDLGPVATFNADNIRSFGVDLPDLGSSIGSTLSSIGSGISNAASDLGSSFSDFSCGGGCDGGGGGGGD